MKPLQFYKYATWGLLLLNLSMITFFFLTKPAPPPPDRKLDFQAKAVEMLQLDKQQKTLFIQSAKDHNQKMTAIAEQQKSLLQSYFQRLTDPSEKVDAEALLNEVQRHESDKIEYTYRHFEEIQSMLNPEQRADFELFVNQALKVILTEEKKNPPPPKDF